MFSRLNQIVIVAVLGLCLWSFYQSQRINRLKADNQTQAQTIEQLTQQQRQLTLSLEQERQAIVKLTAEEHRQKVKADEDIQIIDRTLSKEHCATTRLPADVIKRLQQSD
ncbi:DUF2570 family protein [Volucribacter amazonae]|uniref:DUF2570 domain-containing protein n=1 Tax=Volucribacter amazonae TaxID=256731 RepID=A0A9X4PG11_9PAST|nr:DUF2570 family protein [Volucribacter amazonae]MDG6894535.1 hypothetical protein [Volucribacter amazonae]